MSACCPDCGSATLLSQDIESLGNPTVLVKLENRVQRRCTQCGWIAFQAEGYSLESVIGASFAAPRPHARYMARPGLALDDYDT